MKIIKLTDWVLDGEGDSIYLNANHLVFFERDGHDRTLIYTTKSDQFSCLTVLETPEEIFELIKKSQII